VNDAFSFVDRGRTFTCSAGALRPSAADDIWWWFEVSTEDRNRYAPFRAEAGDTKASVKARVVAFYDNLLKRRAAPSPTPWQRRQAARDAAADKAASPAAPAPAAAPVPAPPAAP
jgi:hypothetical protein